MDKLTKEEIISLRDICPSLNLGSRCWENCSHKENSICELSAKNILSLAIDYLKDDRQKFKSLNEEKSGMLPIPDKLPDNGLPIGAVDFKEEFTRELDLLEKNITDIKLQLEGLEKDSYDFHFWTMKMHSANEKLKMDFISPS